MSCNTGEEEDRKKVENRMNIHILTVCVDGFSKWLSLRKDECYSDTVERDNGPQTGALKT